MARTMTSVRMGRGPLWWLAVAAAAVLHVGCDVPGVELTQPDVSTSPGSESGIYVTLEDTVLAAALGWAQGVPNATVIIHRFHDPYQPDTLYTDSIGFVRFPDLLPGWHLAAGYRELTPDEAGPTGGVLRAFGDGRKFTPSGGVDSLALRMQIDRRGSLVFSEWYMGGSTIDVRYNGWDRFFEFFNNADSTVFVDGMFLGRAYGWVGSSFGGTDRTCEEFEAYRNDPQGVWSLMFHQFPGDGTRFPVAPGQVITVALDAADHSVVHPAFPDLSGADFELEGTADVDNPDVPNMPSPFPATTWDHGMIITYSGAYFLALPRDPATLATQLIGDYRYARFPIESILDVMSADWASEASEPPFAWNHYCTWINRDLDRLETLHYRVGGDTRTSLHRRTLIGHHGLVLQDLNTSFTDWVLAPYSPGRIQY